MSAILAIGQPTSLGREVEDVGRVTRASHDVGHDADPGSRVSPEIQRRDSFFRHTFTPPCNASMRFSDLLFGLFQFLLPPAIIFTSLLYLYPAVQLCAFPEAKSGVAACYANGTPAVKAEKAPFRLLAFADPQLEGDTSIPDHGGLGLLDGERWRREGVGRLRSLVEEDVPRVFQGYRKRLDLWGNDLYLAHVYRTMYWWTNPTHSVVLGDLLGSQWITDEEFQRRTDRFWGRVFKKGLKVPRAVTDSSGRKEVLGAEPEWKRRIIALAGNHDIGYAGDITTHRLERFEDAFGRVNWEISFHLNDSGVSVGPFPTTPELRLIILNSMNLDTPALQHELYERSMDFVTNQLHNPHRQPSSNTGTVLLTHIPFHKEAGICTDGPSMGYDEAGRLREQNHLSQDMSSYILNGLAHHDTPGKAIVLNGHDHPGCDTLHYYSKDTGSEGAGEKWQAQHYRRARSNSNLTGIREVTVRSMMGEFLGNTGMLSAWFDTDTQTWKFEYDQCAVGVQHIWWAIHIADLIVLGIGLGAIVVFFLEDDGPRRPIQRAPPAGKSKSV